MCREDRVNDDLVCRVLQHTRTKMPGPQGLGRGGMWDGRSRRVVVLGHGHAAPTVAAATVTARARAPAVARL